MGEPDPSSSIWMNPARDALASAFVAPSPPPVASVTARVVGWASAEATSRAFRTGAERCSTRSQDQLLQVLGDRDGHPGGPRHAPPLDGLGDLQHVQGVPLRGLVHPVEHGTRKRGTGPFAEQRIRLGRAERPDRHAPDGIPRPVQLEPGAALRSLRGDRPDPFRVEPTQREPQDPAEGRTSHCTSSSAISTGPDSARTLSNEWAASETARRSGAAPSASARSSATSRARR